MTQQYTPVSWQDETTSQQGTLINAERLNQMQTAHHFADGLEEVDQIPTADPGVSYHKIVYCTADATLYRWDGTEWTADIDDDTKHLLEEHEADHENPHQVTKAQVGLGNCDNTSDMDKPISTATQTALDGKLDKLTYPVGTPERAYVVHNGRTQSFRQIRVIAEENTLLMRTPEGRARANFVVDADTDPTDLVTYEWTTAQIGAEATARAEADTALGGRIDTEQARAEAAEQANAQAIANTYTKAETDTLLAGKASTGSVQTLDTRVGTLETGLADTYNKSQVDTYLAAKADQATTYTKTETDTLLAGYVTLNTTQTIQGPKILTNELTNATANNFSRIYTVRQSIFSEGTPPNETKVIWPLIVGNQNTTKYPFRIALTEEATTGRTYASLEVDNPVDDTIARVDILKPPNGVGSLNLYNGTTWSTVATVETLDSYTSMVRTSGNQNIYGIKTHLGDVICGNQNNPDASSLILWASAAYRRFRMRSSVDDVTTTPSSNTPYGLINFSDKNDQTAANIQLVHKSSGGYVLEAVIRKSDNNMQTVVLGETS